MINLSFQEAIKNSDTHQKNIQQGQKRQLWTNTTKFYKIQKKSNLPKMKLSQQQQAHKRTQLWKCQFCSNQREVHLEPTQKGAEEVHHKEQQQCRQLLFSNRLASDNRTSARVLTNLSTMHWVKISSQRWTFLVEIRSWSIFVRNMRNCMVR